MPGTTLLDFVMGLVHDPVAASEYRSNPEQAIADADLHGVTAGDIEALIPMVSGGGQDGAGLQNPDRGIWSGGDVVQSFDAFDSPGLEQESIHSDVDTLEHLDSLQTSPGFDTRGNDGAGLFDSVPDSSMSSPEVVHDDEFAPSVDPLTDPSPLPDPAAMPVDDPSPGPLDSQGAPGAEGFDSGHDWGSVDDFDI
jgi:hypothetical protein